MMHPDEDAYNGERLEPFTDDWLQNPQFDNDYRDNCACADDWRHLIGPRLRSIWPSLTDEVRLAVALNADWVRSNVETYKKYGDD